MLKQGQNVRGSIDGIQCEGKIQIEDGKYYFCQNVKDGNYCSDALGYLYSWSFEEREDGSFTDDVEIDHRYFITRNKKEVLKFNI